MLSVQLQKLSKTFQIESHGEREREREREREKEKESGINEVKKTELTINEAIFVIFFSLVYKESSPVLFSIWIS